MESKTIITQHWSSFFSSQSTKKNIKASDNESKITFISAPSPYYTNATGDPFEYIIIHCIGYNNPLEVLLKNKVSCHYLVPQQENPDELMVYNVVKPPRIAWQAGISKWKDSVNLNHNSIGIEVSMPNYAKALENGTLDYFYFEEFQARQISALKILIKQIQAEYKIPNENILGHSDIAPWRNISTVVLGKTDPGPTFPWKQLAKEGIGVWPKKSCPKDLEKKLNAKYAQQLLREVGYNVPFSEVFDDETNYAKSAAKIRWTPQCYNSSSRLANRCYEEPFDRDLACALYNLANRNYDRPSHSINPSIIIFGIGTPLLFLVLICVLYKYFSPKCTKTYVGLQDQKRHEEIESPSESKLVV